MYKEEEEKIEIKHEAALCLAESAGLVNVLPPGPWPWVKKTNTLFLRKKIATFDNCQSSVVPKVTLKEKNLQETNFILKTDLI